MGFKSGGLGKSPISAPLATDRIEVDWQWRRPLRTVSGLEWGWRVSMGGESLLNPPLLEALIEDEAPLALL